MKRSAMLKCLFCRKLFQTDRRNRRHQKYCAEPACRKASKAASQRVWLAKAENQNYFRGPENVARVQAWREAHPQYWQRPAGQRAQGPVALQDLLSAQPIEIKKDPKALPPVAIKDTLQDLMSFQPAVLIGLISQLTGSRLQDDIVRSTRRLVEHGQDILIGRFSDDHQDANLPRAGP